MYASKSQVTWCSSSFACQYFALSDSYLGAVVGIIRNRKEVMEHNTELGKPKN